MIRKDVLHSDLDHGVVKWSLIAAAFALVVGCYAEAVHSSALDAGAATAVQVIEAPVQAVSAAS